MKTRATLSDVARIAGVTMMTVSRVINNKPGVSAEMRQKILDIAREIDYRPNQIARGLATNQTTTVGLVVPDNTNPFFAQIARGVEDHAYERGYNIFLINTAEDTTRELRALDSLWEKDVDGLILCSSRLPNSRLEKQIERFSATVLLNRELKTPMPGTITINLNDQNTAHLAVSHFLSSGRRCIAHISGPSNSNSAQKRLEGFKAALKAANLPYDASLVESSPPDTESGHTAAGNLLAAHPEIDAIFAFNDLVAMGALQYCLEIGKQVPQDIAIMGVDDIPLASIVRPKLTTLHFNQNYIGRLAMRTLLEIVAGEASPASIRIEPELYVRESA
ncbi:MAG: LacI family transcriptional regulator [Chloroflexi bacterium]|jgi:LacI family transcriptional regulator|nr:LacI family DNA-binding transcriptional regulator [Anaerolineaceae bacterium]NMB87912.1 LacI family transcriptional regulator [Chloroflexota bacterium]